MTQNLRIPGPTPVPDAVLEAQSAPLINHRGPEFAEMLREISGGIAGLTLGGGIGWLNGKHALACDNVRSVDIVTADAKLRTATAAD